MTIEKSPPSTANQPNRTEGAGAKSRSGSANGSDEGAGGFTAILGAIGEAPAATDPASSDSSTAADSKTAGGHAQSDGTNAVLDASTLLQQNPQIAAAQALQAAADAAAAASGVDTKALAGAAGAAAAAQTALDPAALAQAAALNALAHPATAAAPTSPLPAVAARAAGRGLPGTPDAVALTDAGAANPAATAQSLLQARAKASKAGNEAALPTSTSSNSSGNSPVAAGAQADTAKFLATLEQAQAAQTGNRSPEPLLATLQAKTDKPQTERSGQTVKSADPTYAGTALGMSGPDFSQTVTQASATPEMQVAEQVSYWVTHNVQNAELKLDGLGQAPVAVSISVQGNEAQISFRSDELATRDMLEASGTHLKDLLQREGLVLTGVSVGTSGSGEAQGREQRGRQNVRQGLIAPLQVTSQDSTARLRSATPGGSGRSVDLFV